MVDVELAGGAGCQEGVVDAVRRGHGLLDDIEAAGGGGAGDGRGGVGGNGVARGRLGADGILALLEELADIQVEGQVLLAVGVPKVLAEEQAQGGVAQDLVELLGVGVARDARARRGGDAVALGGAVALDQVDDVLALLRQLVDGGFGGLEARGARLVLGELGEVGAVGLDTPDELVLEEEGGELGGLAAVDGGAAVHEPVGGGLAGEGLVEGARGVAEAALAGHAHAGNAVLVLAERVRVGGAGADLDVGAVLADEAPEDDLDGAAVRRQLVGLRVPLQDDQLHGIARGIDELGDVPLDDAVLEAEAFQDVDPFRGQLPDGALHGELAGLLAIGRLDEAGVEEALADGAGHLARHGEGGGGRGGDDAGGVLGVGHAVGLGELEGAQVVDGLF